MPRITLYGVAVSAFVAKVRIVLKAKSIPFEEVAPEGGYSGDAYAGLVPVQTMPAIDHDGFVVWDSEAINEYLEEVFPLPSMVPSKAQERAYARALSRFVDTRLEPPLRSLFAHVGPTSRDDAFVDRQFGLLELRLGQWKSALILDGILGRHHQERFL